MNLVLLFCVEKFSRYLLLTILVFSVLLLDHGLSPLTSLMINPIQILLSQIDVELNIK